MRSLSFVAIGLVVVIVSQPQPSSAAPGGSAPVSPRPESTARETLARIVESLNDGRSQDAYVAARALAASPDFKDLPAALQLAVWRIIGGIAIQSDRPAEALAASQRATESASAVDEDWLLRVQAAVSLEDWEETAVAVIGLARRGRDALGDMAPEFVRQVAWSLSRQGSGGLDTQSRVIDALFASGWNDEASGLWTMRASQLLDAGEHDRAAAMIARVDGSGSLIAMSVDRRFDAVREAMGGAFPVQEALDRELEAARSAAAAAGATLPDRYRYALTLMDRGRFEDALAEVDAALAAARAEAEKPNGRPPAVDDEIWALDTRSRILVSLGRGEDAIADLRRAARRPEHGAQNVSHAINLGWLYLRLDQPQAALDAVADMDDTHMSPFGAMQMQQVRACAAHALGRDEEAKRAYDHILAHSDADPSAAEVVAACRGDMPAAVASFLLRLEDPGTRMQALVGAQDYLEPPFRSRFDQNLLAAGRAIRADPAVQDALARYGRVQRWPVVAPPQV